VRVSAFVTVFTSSVVTEVIAKTRSLARGSRRRKITIVVVAVLEAAFVAVLARAILLEVITLARALGLLGSGGSLLLIATIATNSATASATTTGATATTTACTTSGLGDRIASLVRVVAIFAKSALALVAEIAADLLAGGIQHFRERSARLTRLTRSSGLLVASGLGWRIGAISGFPAALALLGLLLIRATLLAFLVITVRESAAVGKFAFTVVAEVVANAAWLIGAIRDRNGLTSRVLVFALIAESAVAFVSEHSAHFR